MGPENVSLYRSKILMKDALGLTCDRVYHWRLHLVEYGPEIIYIEGIHNTVAEAIPRLDFGPSDDNKENSMTFTKCWCFYTRHAEKNTSSSNYIDLMNFVFEKCSEETVIYPLTVRAVAGAQTKDKMLHKLTLLEKYKSQLIEGIQVLCQDGKLVIPQELQQHAVEWYHHHFQQPGTTHLGESLHTVMYWSL